MDYENKHKEALERARVKYAMKYQPIHQDLVDIFPELAKSESEGERIRKALLEMVHDTTGDSLWVDYNIHKEDALAWLEKRAEQKPADKVEPKFHEYSTMLQSIWGKVCELEGKLGDIYKAVSKPYQDIPQLRCWFADGTCMNPYHDCVNCPRQTTGGGWSTSIATNKTTNSKAE